MGMSKGTKLDQSKNFCGIMCQGWAREALSLLAAYQPVAVSRVLSLLHGGKPSAVGQKEVNTQEQTVLMMLFKSLDFLRPFLHLDF